MSLADIEQSAKAGKNKKRINKTFRNAPKTHVSHRKISHHQPGGLLPVCSARCIFQNLENQQNPWKSMKNQWRSMEINENLGFSLKINEKHRKTWNFKIFFYRSKLTPKTLRKTAATVPVAQERRHTLLSSFFYKWQICLDFSSEPQDPAHVHCSS